MTPIALLLLLVPQAASPRLAPTCFPLAPRTLAPGPAAARTGTGLVPLLVGADWTAEPDQASASFGSALATAGDVNGDGYADVIVGAPWFDGGQSDEGRVFVFHGSASGLATSPSWMAEADQASARFGIAVASAGDVNGDGYDDVIVGADQYSNDQMYEGRVFVYHGSASGLGASPAWTAEGDQSTCFFGVSVASAGDVDGDGYDDVIVGAPWFENDLFAPAVGRAFVYHGSAAGLATTPAWITAGDQAFTFLGGSVSTAGDVNGDGYHDIVVGLHQLSAGQEGEGGALVFHGSPSGLSASPAWSAEGGQAHAHFGSSVAAAGDVNGDGYGDLLVGAHIHDNLVRRPSTSAGALGHGQLGTPRSPAADEGRAYVFHGSPSGLAATPAWTAEGERRGDYFGQAVATAGDVNGDGHADVLVGAPYRGAGEPDEGRATLYLGSAGGLLASPAATHESDQARAFLGWSVATAGDVNADGFADLLVGAPAFDAGEPDEGRAFLFLGP